MIAKILLIGLVGMVALGLPGNVFGQYGGYQPIFAAYCGGSAYRTTYSSDSIPYFALHPPVYYSYRVARTYGYSPFAYPPGVLTPGAQPPSVAVQDWYAPTEGETSESPRRVPKPQRIDNPFVDQPSGPGVTSDRKPSGRRPQVVYPAAMARRGHISPVQY